MTSKKFRQKLVELIELTSTSDFVTDTIDMEGITTPFDEVIYVAGEGETQVFLIHIQKI